LVNSLSCATSAPNFGSTPATGGPPSGPYNFNGMPNSGMVGAGMNATDNSHSAHMVKSVPGHYSAKLKSRTKRA